MTTKETPTKIKLWDTYLDVYRFKSGAYAAPGLFRLFNTDIYRYGECWYWLGNPPLALNGYGAWDWDRQAFLSIVDNKLSYLFADPVDPEREIDDDNVEISTCAVPNEIDAVISFCSISRLLSDEVIDDLLRLVDQCRSGSPLTRLAAQAFLLRDTEQDLRQ